MDEQELHHRVKNAITILADGHPFTVGDLTFRSKDENHFSVTGWTISKDLGDVTIKSATIELNDIKNLFARMTNASKELADFIQGRKIEYCLGYDYRMGAIRICKETNGQITWELELKK